MQPSCIYNVSLPLELKKVLQKLQSWQNKQLNIPHWHRKCCNVQPNDLWWCGSHSVLRLYISLCAISFHLWNNAFWTVCSGYQSSVFHYNIASLHWYTIKMAIFSDIMWHSTIHHLCLIRLMHSKEHDKYPGVGRWYGKIFREKFLFDGSDIQ